MKKKKPKLTKVAVELAQADLDFIDKVCKKLKISRDLFIQSIVVVYLAKSID